MRFNTDQQYTFTFPTTIRFGLGVIKELSAYLKDSGKQRPLVVTDPVIAELDFFKSIMNDLDKAGMHAAVFSDIHKNPVKSDVLAGGDAFDEHKADCIVGVGGGAALDVARAIVLRIEHREDLFKYDDLIGGDKYVTNGVPFFVTVPTTSGTGSEVGRSAIISEDESKKKRILFSPKLMAKMVFADPELTYGLPPFVTAATGMDAMTHNMEAYVAKNYNPMCEGIALKGIAMIADNIEAAVKDNTPRSRAAMLMASMMGAIAFQKGLGVVHSLAHPLSTLLDMHHGLGNAIMIPYGMEFNIAGFEPYFENIAAAMGRKGGNGDTVISALFELNDKLGLPKTLGLEGVKAEHLDTLSDLAVADFAHPNNPKPVVREDFLAIYKKAL